MIHNKYEPLAHRVQPQSESNDGCFCVSKVIAKVQSVVSDVFLRSLRGIVNMVM